MKLHTIILIIVLIYLLGFLSHGVFLKRTVYGDGRYYYAWLRSLVIDRDINFTDEYKHFLINEPNTPTELPRNKYSIGSALLWTTPYMLVHLIIRGDGWLLPYEFSVGLFSALSAITGLILLTRLIKHPSAVVGLTLLLIAGATNLLFYGSIDTVNSHALSFFIATILLSLVTSKRPNSFAIGLFLALLSSIRLQDIVFLLLLLPMYRRIHISLFLTGFILGFLPQLACWYTLYGSLNNPYLAGGERFDFFHPHVFDTLFSPNNGLFLWTPVVGIGFFGLIINWRKYWPYLAVFLSELFIVSSWEVWWQGASVSGRMFVSTLPLIAIGLGAVVRTIYRNRLNRTTLPVLAASLCILNIMITLYYLVTH